MTPQEKLVFTSELQGSLAARKRPQYVVAWAKKWDKKAGIFVQKERTPQDVVCLSYKA